MSFDEREIEYHAYRHQWSLAAKLARAKANAHFRENGKYPNVFIVSDRMLGGNTYIYSHGRLFKITRQRLGRGAFGEVFLVIDSKGEKYALKRETYEVARKADIAREVGITRDMDRVIADFRRGYGDVRARNVEIASTLMPLVKGKTLFSVITEGYHSKSEGRTVSLTTDMRVLIGIEITKALDALHKRGIIHTDLHTGNIMVDIDDSCEPPKVQVEIIDFGLAVKKKDDGDEVVHPKWTRGRAHVWQGHYAPETSEKGYVTEKSDIWKLGQVFISLGLNTRSIDLDRRMVATDPAERPSANDIISELYSAIGYTPDMTYRSEATKGIVRADRHERFTNVAQSYNNLMFSAESLGEAAETVPEIVVRLQELSDAVSAGEDANTVIESVEALIENIYRDAGKKKGIDQAALIIALDLRQDLIEQVNAFAVSREFVSSYEIDAKFLDIKSSYIGATLVSLDPRAQQTMFKMQKLAVEFNNDMLTLAEAIERSTILLDKLKEFVGKDDYEQLIRAGVDLLSEFTAMSEGRMRITYEEFLQQIRVAKSILSDPESLPVRIEIPDVATEYNKQRGTIKSLFVFRNSTREREVRKLQELVSRYNDLPTRLNLANLSRKVIEIKSSIAKEENMFHSALENVCDTLLEEIERVEMARKAAIGSVRMKQEYRRNRGPDQ